MQDQIDDLIAWSDRVVVVASWLHEAMVASDFQGGSCI